MVATAQKHQLILIDGHVHLHDCFDIDQLLTSAWVNFQRFSGQAGDRENFQAVLLLTEIEHQKWYKKLADLAQNNNQSRVSQGKPWMFHRTQEDLSLYTCNALGQGMFLIAGRQIVTAENLEVLALITDQNLEDGLPLDVTIKAILAAGGIPILPWGVGKWLGNRGKLLNKLLEDNNFPKLFLGDNGGRPVFWSRPVLFKQAEKKGWRILPGSDPLPLASESCRPGSFGFTIQGSLSNEEPGKDIKEMLLNPLTPIQGYGSLENPWRFIRNQLAIRSRKNSN
ncbi:MAG: hypothetical protein F6K63_09370 [Moorea sp. SIO1G6]|uniref:hypothetical protein n=1 Tax=Moorena sp. SIO1G6 TaxID=2607840 RepID=UPI0013C0B041|nr:hypothetical protein [Moorena sp. SIO1G6]NET64584.1 hypothetical protein [Moorena sp. SIO1G6]